MQDKYECPPLLYCTPWFMTMYTTTLPWPTVLRIWDILFCEGNLILLKVALGIFKELESTCFFGNLFFAIVPF